MKTRLSYGLLLAALTAASSAQANGTASTGTIRRLDAVAAAGGAPGGADTRVYLNGVDTLCAGAADPSWGFINSNDANYKGVLATLMLAYATNKSVVVWTLPAPIAAGGTFCQITWVNVLG